MRNVTGNTRDVGNLSRDRARPVAKLPEAAQRGGSLLDVASMYALVITDERADWLQAGGGA